MTTATVTFLLPGHTSLDDRDALVEKVRETALPLLSDDGRSLTIEWDSDNDWDLRGLVQETLDIVDSNFSISVDMDTVQR